EHHLDVRVRPDLVDEVPGHALLQALAPDEEGDAPGVAGEVERRLAGRVPRPDEEDIEPLGVAGFAPRRTVVDALADQSIDSLDLEATPAHAGGEDDGPCAEHVVTIEEDLAGLGVDAEDLAGDEDLGAEALRLVERADGKLVAGHPVGEAEVVL